MAKSESHRTGKPDSKGNAGSATVDDHQEVDESRSQNEEAVISLQQQIEKQREETSQLRELIDSRLESSRGEAEAGPVGEILTRMGSVERQIESIGSDSRVDALMLRTTEMERKLSAGASEPLLNEIARRLDVLERDGGAGSVSSELERKVSDLASKMGQLPATDPRMDDIVLRVGSVETVTKGPVEDPRVEGLERQLDTISAEQLGDASRRWRTMLFARRILASRRSTPG